VERYLLCWFEGGKKKYMKENGRETKTSAAVLSGALSIPPKPFLLIGPLHGWKGDGLMGD